MKAFCDYNEYEIVGEYMKTQKNLADVLATLQVKQDFGVNLICVANGIVKYLENYGIHKMVRQNGKNPLFEKGH